MEYVEEIKTYLTGLNLFEPCLNYGRELFSDLPAGQLREIADRMLMSDIPLALPFSNPLPNPSFPDISSRQSITKDLINHDVKIKLTPQRYIEKILVRKNGYEKYISVPFDWEGNPRYVQNILNMWFFESEGQIGSKFLLFEQLEQYYSGSRQPYSSRWLFDNVEWVKFSYMDGSMYPIDFKPF